MALQLIRTLSIILCLVVVDIGLFFSALLGIGNKFIWFGLNTVVCGIGSEVESMVLLFILILLQALLGFLSSIMSLGFSLLTAKEHFFLVLSFEEALVVGLLFDDEQGSDAVVDERKVIQG